jgi:hypothetical protein
MTTLRYVHYAAVLRILCYVKGTLFHGLHFSSHSSLDLHVYLDADWASDPIDRHSTMGYCFLLGDSLISWCSKKQSVVARSSTEAKYRALADTTSELLWLRWLLHDMGLLSFVTIKVQFRLRIMMHFMNVLNILRSTVILCAITFCRELSAFVLLLSLISWPMCSPKHIHLDGLVTLFPNSSWHLRHHLEFEGRC